MTQKSGPLLNPKEVVLVAIDLQTKLMPVVSHADRVIKNTALLLQAGQILSIPAIVTTQYAKGLGPLVPEVALAAAGVVTVDKISFGCFGDEKFVEQLKGMSPERNTLLVAGVESHVCVAQTVLAAIDAGYEVQVAEDATSSRTPENRQVGINRLARAGAVISSTEMMIYELLGKSGTPEFKAILPLLK